MQKWIGVGRIDGEPVNVRYGDLCSTLIWVSCPRSWQPSVEDSIPVLFIGKRKVTLTNSGLQKFDGSLVYVIGELSSRVKLNTEKVVNIGTCVFATSITFWDTASIEKMRKGKVNNEIIFESSLEDIT